MMNNIYDIILADPPWKYDFSRSSKRRIEQKYHTMELSDICELEIPASDNSVLLLWATPPKLEEALYVMKAWNFKYKTVAVVWDKKKMGMGYWFRGRVELLLLGIRGKPKLPDAKDRYPNMLYWNRSVLHSHKPSIVHLMIEKMFPGTRKLEMFARFNHFGWDCWGDQLK